MRGTRWATIASSSAAVVTTCEVSSSGSDSLLGQPGEVHDRVEPLRWTAANTAATASASAQSASCQAQRRALGRRHQVEPDDVVAELGQPDRDDPAEAAGGARDEDAHQTALRSPVRRPG